MLFTHSVVMVAILALLAPGGLSWLREARSASTSFTVGVAMMESLLYAPFAMAAVEATALRSGRLSAVSPVYRWLTAITE